MTKQQALDHIKTIKSPISLSGFYKELPIELRADEDIIKAVKERRKEI